MAQTTTKAARLAGAAIGVLVTVSGLDAGDARAAWNDVCAQTAREIERREGIPPGLVVAVALAESGRWSDAQGRSVPWPWTITSGSDSFYLPSKEAALAKVQELRAAGRTNIDIGCMQVNLYWHGDAFASIAEGLDPETNIAYGADFLMRLRAETRSWGRATARYHSSYPERGENYRSKVWRLWNDVRQRLAGERRSETRLAGSIRPPDAPARGTGSRPRLIMPAAAKAAPPGGIAVLRGR